jgi:LysW-gamma-L-lysine carboxypeptidase
MSTSTDGSLTPVPSRTRPRRHPVAPTDEQAVDLLEDLVRTRSESGAEQEASRLLVDRMASWGLAAWVDEAGNAIGDSGGEGPHIELLGHIDTVPGVVPVRREGRKLYGRGSVDAKGPLVAFAVAAARAHAKGGLVGRVTVAGCVEEEACSSKGARHRALQPAPDACVIGEPSQWDRMTLGYKGYVRAHLSLLDDVAHGAHASPSAAARACLLWARIERDAEAFNAGRDALFDQLMPHLNGVTSASDGLAETARLELTLRLPEDLSPAAAVRWLTDRAPGWQLVTEGDIPAWSGPRTTPLHRSLARQIAAQGGHARYVRKTGTADINVVAPRWGCPCLAYGPGDSALDHTPDEHVDLDEFLRAVRVLEGLLGDSTWANSL